jgi:hypothetical protein
MIPKPSAIFSSIITGLKIAQQNQRLPFWIVLAIAMYMPLEEFVIKWLPISGGMAAILRFMPEMVLYGLLLKILWLKIRQKKRLKKTPIDILLLAFIIAVLISSLLNKASIFTAIVTLRPNLRYVSVYYLVVNIKISADEASKLLNGVKFLGLGQGILASIQYFLPQSINQTLFAPRTVGIGDYQRTTEAEAGTMKLGAVFGTLEGPTILASFLMLNLTIFLSLIYTKHNFLVPSVREIMGIIFLYFGLFATKKRTALFLGFLIPLLIFWFLKRRKPLAKILYFYIFIGFIIVLMTLMVSVDTSFASKDARTEEIDLLSYFVQIFSADYWENSASTSRGWFIKISITAIFKSGNWFGFGPDQNYTREQISNVLTNLNDKEKIFEYHGSEDVYFFSIFTHFGLVGIIIYLMIFYRLFQVSRQLLIMSSTKEYRQLGLMFKTLLLITFVYSFIARIMKLRAFSFYFWLFAGLVTNAYLQEKTALEKKQSAHD